MSTTASKRNSARASEALWPRGGTDPAEVGKAVVGSRDVYRSPIPNRRDGLRHPRGVRGRHHTAANQVDSGIRERWNIVPQSPSSYGRGLMRAAVASAGTGTVHTRNMTVRLP